MSTKKGPPKHQNTHAWKSDKFKTDGKTKVLQNLKVIFSFLFQSKYLLMNVSRKEICCDVFYKFSVEP